MAQKAIAMDDSIADAHGILSNLYIRKRYYDKAIAEAERAVALEPGGAFAHEMYAWSLRSSQAGRKKRSQYARKQSDSTLRVWVRPCFIFVSALPSG